MSKLLCWYPFHKDNTDWSNNHEPVDIPLTPGGVMGKATEHDYPYRMDTTLTAGELGSRGTIAFFIKTSGETFSQNDNPCIIGTGESSGKGVTGRTCDLFAYPTLRDFHWSFQTGNGVLYDVFPDGEWVHVAYVSDGVNSKILINNKIEATGLPPFSPTAADYAPLRLGMPGCQMCDLRIYDDAISDNLLEEISMGIYQHLDFNEPLAQSINVGKWSGVYSAYATLLESGLDYVKVEMKSESLVAIRPQIDLTMGKNFRLSGKHFVNGKPGKLTDITGYGFPRRTVGDAETGYFEAIIMNVNGSYIIHSYHDYNIGDIVEFKDLSLSVWDSGDAPIHIKDRSGLKWDMKSNSTNHLRTTRDTMGNFGLDMDAGTADTVVFEGTPEMDTRELTINSWVNIRSLPSDQVSIADSDAYQAVKNVGGKGRLQGYWYGYSPAGYHQGNIDVPLNEMVMLTNVWNGQTLCLYVNGVLDVEVATAHTAGAYYPNPNISQNVDHRTMDVVLSERTLMGRAISADSVKRLYENRAAADMDGTLAVKDVLPKRNHIDVIEGIRYDYTPNSSSASGTQGQVAPDLSPFEEIDNTLGDIMFVADVYVSNPRHYLTKLEISESNNTNGVTLYCNKENWKAGWNSVICKKVGYLSLGSIDWTSDLITSQAYFNEGTANESPAADPDAYILVKNLRAYKGREGRFAPEGKFHRMSVDARGRLSMGHIGQLYKPSQIDYSIWDMGPVSFPRWTRNGSAAENTITVLENPWGDQDAMWYTPGNDVSSDGDGGFETNYSSIDNTKKYRYSIWVRRPALLDGRSYLGLRGKDKYGNGGKCRRLGATGEDSNPYFWHSIPANETWFNDEWFLVVGHIHENDKAGVINDEDSGIYKADGSKMVTAVDHVNDYRWNTDATQANMRAYLFYSTQPLDDQMLYRPRIDLCDGTEPSIVDLITGNDNPNLLPMYDGESFNPTVTEGPLRHHLLLNNPLL